jgi:DNA-binding NtrC family response regulator
MAGREYFDLQPFLELADNILRGGIRNAQELFARLARACVENQPCQAADVLVLDPERDGLVRYAAAFRLSDEIREYNANALAQAWMTTHEQVDARLTALVNSERLDLFDTALRDAFHAGRFKNLPLDVNFYPLQGPSATASTVSRPKIYNDLRNDYLADQTLDPRYVPAFETFHERDLRPQVGAPSLRSMIVAPFCALADMTFSDGTEVPRGRILGKLRLLNRTQDSATLTPGAFTDADANIANLVAFCVFSAAPCFARHQARSSRRGKTIRLSELSEPVLLIDPDVSHTTIPDYMRLRGIVGSAQCLRDVVTSLQRRAHAEAIKTLMLLGPTGSGKEDLARFFHRQSPRCKGPFRPVDCTILRAADADVQLFGHAPDFFANARKERKGYVRAADKGTLFLDEFGKLSRELQTKLLRALDPGYVTPTGLEDNDPIPVNIRLVVATSESKETLTCGEAPRIPAEVYRRIGGAHALLVPPLRERGATDIEMLWRWFLRLSLESDDVEIDRGLFEFLRDEYTYPGNVAEIQEAARHVRAAGWQCGEVITIDVLSQDMQKAWEKRTSERGHVGASVERQASVGGTALVIESRLAGQKERRRKRREFNVARFLVAVNKHQGDVDPAADEIDWPRSTVWSYLRKEPKLREAVNEIRKRWDKPAIGGNPE